MPKVLDSLVKKLMQKQYSEQQAYAIATKKLQEYGYLKKGTNTLTKKGIIKEKQKK